MPLPSLKSLFTGGASTLIDSAKGIISQFKLSPEQEKQFTLDLEKEVNRHMEALESNVTKAQELDNQDRNSARGREADFVKSTGHMDWMQTVVGVLVMLTFIGALLMIGFRELPKGSEHLMINAIGIMEGLVLSVVTYYYGSSAGSRIKDMNQKK